MSTVTHLITQYLFYSTLCRVGSVDSAACEHKKIHWIRDGTEVMWCLALFRQRKNAFRHRATLRLELRLTNCARCFFPLCRDSLSRTMGVKQSVAFSHRAGVFIHVVHSTVSRLLGHNRHAAEMNLDRGTHSRKIKPILCFKFCSVHTTR